MGINWRCVFAGIDPRRNFRLRLGLAIGSVALILSILLSLLVGYTVSQQLEASTGKFLADLSYQMADKLDRGMFERYRDIQIAASLETLNKPNSSDAKRAFLEKLKNTYNDYAWIGLANPEGKVVVSTGGILEGKNVSNRPWFINGKKQIAYVGDVHKALMLAKILPNPTGEPLRFVDVTSQVKDAQGNLIGVLGAHLSWEWAKKVQDSVLRAVAKHDNVEMLVLSKNGDILLAPPNFKQPGSKLKSFKLAQSGQNSYTIETWLDGKQYLTGFSPSVGYLNYPGLNWVILVRQSTDIAFAGAATLERQVIIWGVILGLISASLSWLIANRIVKPILAISDAAKRIRGNNQVNIPLIQGRDEIATLSISLHKLVAKLENQQARLQSLNEELQQDIIARQKAETQLHILNQELEMRVQQRTTLLEAANKELEAFSYSVSHDLSAPLRRIESFSQMLLKRCSNQLDTTSNLYLNRISYSIKQMQQLIQDMLLLSRVSRSEIHLQNIDLSVMVHGISQELVAAEPERQVLFSISEGVTGYADKRLIHCVLENLIGNAWKYTKNNENARIEFGMIENQDGNTSKSPIFFVRDNGAGFNMKYQDKLFSPFQRLHSESEFEGTGIGLATVQRIINRHKGQIWAEGIVGKGATFYFTIGTSI